MAHKFNVPKDCKVAAFGNQVYVLKKGDNFIECNDATAAAIQIGIDNFGFPKEVKKEPKVKKALKSAPENK